MYRGSKNGSSGLVIAAEEGRVDIVKFLIDRGANVESKNKVGKQLQPN